MTRHGIVALVILAAASAQAARQDGGVPRIMQGPMVGAVTAESITVWVRTNGEMEVRLEVGADPQLADARRSAVVRTEAARDYTARITVRGLEPGTRYYYRPLVDDEPSKYLAGHPPFVTQTAPAGPEPFTLAFGSCARF